MKNIYARISAVEGRSKADDSEIDEIKWVGRGILSAVAFLVGVIITQYVSKFMATRKPRSVRAHERVV
jgi:hypothetical protein